MKELNLKKIHPFFAEDFKIQEDTEEFIDAIHRYKPSQSFLVW